MKKIQVLGSGCSKCQKTAEMITDIAKQLGIDADIEKDTSMDSLLKYQVMSTPAVILDGKLVHSGGLPNRKTIESWLSA